MFANVEVVNKVVNHYVRAFREEVRLTKRTNIETELRLFFTRHYPGSSLTRSEAITNARYSLGIDLARFEEVQVGTIVLNIDDIKYDSLDTYPKYRLGSIGRDEDNAFRVVDGVEYRYTSRLYKGEYIPLEMFTIIKRKLENSISEYFPELVISARDILVNAIKDAVTIRRSKIQSLLFRATNSLQLDRSHEDYTSLNYIYDFNQVEREIVAEEFDKRVSVIPGVFFEASQPIQMKFNELMTGIRQDVAVKIFGENMDTLLSYANKVNEVVQNVEGATEPSVERVSGLPQIVIKYNRSQIANYGLNIKDINQIVSTAFAGSKAGVVFENERKFDLVVRLDSMHRENIEDVNHLYIPTANGAQIPLSQVAVIKMELGAAQISREGGKRRIVIGFNVKDRDVASVVEDIEKQLNEKVKLPEGYYYTYGGTFENLQAASKRLLIAVPVALALIFMLLYLIFININRPTSEKMHQIIPVNLFLVSFVFGFFSARLFKSVSSIPVLLRRFKVNRSPWMPSVYFNLIFNTSLPSVPAVAATMEGTRLR